MKRHSVGTWCRCTAGLPASADRGDMENEFVEVSECEAGPDRRPDPGPREAAEERRVAVVTSSLAGSPQELSPGADDGACL
jgi:hypothetical protein